MFVRDDSLKLGDKAKSEPNSVPGDSNIANAIKTR
jgi:hypothetical protein